MEDKESIVEVGEQTFTVVPDPRFPEVATAFHQTVTENDNIALPEAELASGQTHSLTPDPEAPNRFKFKRRRFSAGK